jgi:hypothetical protein
VKQAFNQKFTNSGSAWLERPPSAVPESFFRQGKVTKANENIIRPASHRKQDGHTRVQS